jgi:hypothetical protein
MWYAVGLRRGLRQRLITLLLSSTLHSTGALGSPQNAPSLDSTVSRNIATQDRRGNLQTTLRELQTTLRDSG